MSTFNDAQVLLTFLKDCFLNMGDRNDTVSTLHYDDSVTFELEILTKNTEYEHVTDSKLDSKVMSCIDADIKEQDTDVLQNNNELSLVTSNCNSGPIRMTDQSGCDVHVVPDPHRIQLLSNNTEGMNIITGLSDQARTINDPKDGIMLHVGSLLRAYLRSGKRK